MTIRKAIAACASLGAALALCAPSTLAADPPFEIPVLIAQTGSAAFAGHGMQSALTVLESITNKEGGIKGRPIHFVFSDEQTSPQVSVQLTNALIAKKVQAMLGPGDASSCRATEPLIKNGPVQYCGSPAMHPVKNGYMFTPSASSIDGLTTLVKYARLRGWQRIAFITTTDAVGQDGDNALDALLAQPENAQLTLVDREHFAPTDISVAAQMAKIKASGPAIVFLWTAGTAFGTLLHGVSESGIVAPMAASGGVMTYGQMKQYLNIMPPEIYFPGLGYITPTTAGGKLGERQRAFRDGVRAIGMQPDLESGLFWDAGLILVDAYRHVGTNATASQIHDYIENLYDFYGICGIYDFRGGNQRGLGSDSIVVMRWDNAKTDWFAVSSAGGAVLK